jgi:phosphonate transport system substrate-binding protein
MTPPIRYIFFVKKFFVLSSLASLLIVLPAAPAASRAAAKDGTVYTIGIIPYYSPEKIWNSFSPLVGYLNSKTGEKWELKLFASHDAMVNDICAGAVTVAFLGPVPLGRTNKTCGVEPLVVSLGPDGKPFYHSVIVTTDPKVRSLADLKGRTLGVFKGSTASHVVPEKMLREAGLGIDSFKRAFYESQDSIISALLRSEIAAGGVKESLFKKFKHSGLRVIATSDPLPHFAFCAPPSLDQRVRERLIDALLALHPRTNEQHRAITATWDDEIKNGFIPPPPSHLKDAVKLRQDYEEIVHAD